MNRCFKSGGVFALCDLVRESLCAFNIPYRAVCLRSGNQGYKHCESTTVSLEGRADALSSAHRSASDLFSRRSQ